jgi:hypothetical protein
MERFIKRHEGRIEGIIAGYDRMIFRGTLRSISYVKGMEIWLSSRGVLLKEFGKYAEGISQEIIRCAEEMAKQVGQKVEYLKTAKESKEEIAREMAEEKGIQEGLVCILSSVEPCHSYSVRGDRESHKLRLVWGPRKCLHFYYYYLDREFGLMHVRLQSWFPFTIRVYINGREYLARAMEREGIAFEKADNCFTRIADLPRAQQLMDELSKRRWVGLLNALARRVNPLLAKSANLDLRPYYWSIWEGEYATDVLFKRTDDLEAIYPALCHHAIEVFGSKDVLRFLGRRTNARFAGESSSSLKTRVEGVRVKHWIEENSIKIYDKAGSVLRVETTINNPRRFKVRRRTTRQGKQTINWVPMRRGIADLGRRVELSRAANGRYLDALAVVGIPTPSHRILDPVSKPVEKQGRRYRALRPISPEDSRLFGVVMRGEFELQSVRNQDVRRELYPEAELDPKARAKNSARVSRHLGMLRAHGLIQKVTNSNCYRATKKGLEVMSTAIKFRDYDLALLAN